MEIRRQTVTMEMDCLQLSKDLKNLQTKCNHGRGLSCVETIIMYLDSDDFHRANLVANNEYDKISGYPIIAEYIKSNFNLM